MEGHDYSIPSLSTAMGDVSLVDSTAAVNGSHVEPTEISPSVSRVNPYASMYNRHTPSFAVPNLRPDYLFLKYVLSDSGSHARTQPSVSSLSFDHQEELLWMGNDSGHVTSYYGLEMTKYTSFQVHSENDIRAQLTGDYGLLSLTKNSLRMSIRRGLTIFNHTSDYLKDMYCMASTQNPSIILMAGQQSEMLEFDLEHMKPVRVTNIDTDMNNSDPDLTSGCMIIRTHPKFVCCGDASGKITLRDNSSLKVQHTLVCHSAQLSDFDVCGNHLVTCGYSKRNGNYNVDRFLMVYDLRMVKAIAPIGMNYAPFLLRFVPIYSSKFCVVSPTGQFTLMDTSGPSSPPPFVHSIELPPGAAISAFDVSNSSQSLAFGDSSGFIYLFGASSEVIFNVNSMATEFADEMESPPMIPFDDLVTPFTSVPPAVIPPAVAMDDKDSINEQLQDFLSSLSSNWPSEMSKKVYRRSKPIDPEILSSMKMTGSIGYAPNPGRLRFQEIYLENTDDILEPSLETAFEQQEEDKEDQHESKNNEGQEESDHRKDEDQEESSKEGEGEGSAVDDDNKESQGQTDKQLEEPATELK